MRDSGIHIGHGLSPDQPPAVAGPLLVELPPAGAVIAIDKPDSTGTGIVIIFLRKIYYLWCQNTDMSRDDEPSESLRDARNEWQKSTTALERVNQVIEGTATSRTAAEIAEEALVSEPTARKHLRALVRRASRRRSTVPPQRRTPETRRPYSTVGSENFRPSSPATSCLTGSNG